MSDPRSIVDELIRRQRAMYGGGPLEPVLELLAPDVVWRVPGGSPIAGDHRGRDAVASYFELRRSLAGCSIEMHPRATMAHGGTVVKLTDGTATLAGRQVSWETVGVYRLENELVAEVWLVPLDGELFDRLWSVGT